MNKISKELRYRRRHTAKGLCRCCPKPATHHLYCVYHWEKQKEYSRRYKRKLIKKLIEEAKCIACGIKLDSESDSIRVCINCAERGNLGRPSLTLRRRYK
jgi:hypothetical protein